MKSRTFPSNPARYFIGLEVDGSAIMFAGPFASPEEAQERADLLLALLMDEWGEVLKILVERDETWATPN